MPITANPNTGHEAPHIQVFMRRPLVGIDEEVAPQKPILAGDLAAANCAAILVGMSSVLPLFGG